MSKMFDDEMIGNIVQTLEDIGSMLIPGLDSILDRWARRAKYGDIMSENEAYKDLLTRILNAKNYSETELNKLESKLNAIPYFSNYNTRDIINGYKKKLNEQLNKARVMKNNVDSKIQSATSLLDDMQNLSLGDITKNKQDEIKNKINKYVDESREIARNFSLEGNDYEKKI